jgi:peptidoglycan/LPS O-acetylase OafA/YrhL
MKIREIDMAAGWVLAMASLFIFNRDPRWDSTALFFFSHFFMGVMVQRSLRTPRDGWMFFIYLILMAVGLTVEWRGRLVSALVVGCLLYAADRSGWSSRWPKSQIIARLGRMSYSLFLVHFPVLVLVSTVWVKLGWSSPWQAVCGLLTAFAASLAAASLFHRYIEKPASAFARRWMVPTRRNPAEYPPAS